MSDIFEEDLNLVPPAITPAEIREWLQRRITEGVKEIGKMHSAWEGVRDGELPRESFDLKKFETAKRFTALFKTTYDLLIPVIGEAPTDVDPMKVDEEFFALMSKAYGRDVTKGVPA